MHLYEHQQTGYNDIFSEWNQNPKKNILFVQATGSGKTPMAAKVMKDYDGPAMATAHRRELVGQISTAMAMWSIPHRIIAPDNVIRLCIAKQMRKTGRNFYDARAPMGVAAVDTLLSRHAQYRSFLKAIKLHVPDEAHHVIHNPINKWGRGCDLVPNAVHLGFTATAVRADGKGLGKTSNGIFDSIIHGIQMRWLIDNGYLKDYRIFNASRKHLNLTNDDIGSSGDFKDESMARAIKENDIVGDVVETYKKHAMGRRGITFAPTVEIAREITQQFNEAGVPAVCVWDKTSDEARESAVRRLEAGELLQLVNVDLFGEGFDLPAIECASFVRPTMSYGLYVQQFGRPLRPTPGVNIALIFDHVGNVMRHGLPDGDIRYTLEATERHRQVKGVKLARTCDNCGQVYDRMFKQCPHCNWTPIPQSRSAPHFVDGDLTELDPAALEALRQQAAAAIKTPAEYEQELRAKYCPELGVRRHVKLHKGRIEAQRQLRDALMVWSGYRRDGGADDSEIYRRFYHTFGMDILTAQATSAADAAALEMKILRDIN